MDVQGFSKGLKDKLTAAGYNQQEMELGALMAQMQAAMRMIDHPLAAMAVSDTFAKALAILTERDKVAPQRVEAAADVIFNSAMGHARDKLAELAGGDGVRRTVMVDGLDDAPAGDPKDIN